MASVRQFYPRSLLRLILLGNVLVALPLLVAIVFVFFGIGELTDRSETLTREASLASRHGHELLEEMSAMERILRQYEVLGDASLRDDYGAARNGWLVVCREYAAIPLLAELRERVLAILDVEAAAFAEFQTARKSGHDLLGELVELNGRFVKLTEEAGHIADRELSAFRATVNALRQRLLLAMALGLTVVLLLVVFARPRLARVLWGFENAVQALGEGKLDNEIHLTGPEDIREVGRRLDWLRRRLLALEEQRTLVSAPRLPRTQDAAGRLARGVEPADGTGRRTAQRGTGKDRRYHEQQCPAATGFDRQLAETPAGWSCRRAYRIGAPAL